MKKILLYIIIYSIISLTTRIKTAVWTRRPVMDGPVAPRKLNPSGLAMKRCVKLYIRGDEITKNIAPETIDIIHFLTFSVYSFILYTVIFFIH